MQQFLRACAAAIAILALSAAQPALADGADATSEMALLLGSWSCAGSDSRDTIDEVFRRVDNTTMTVAGTGRAHNVDVKVAETLRYDRAGGVWSLEAGKGTFGDTERLEAPAWTGRDWTFTGTEMIRGRSESVRDVYSYFPPDAFVRERQLRDGDRWRADEGYVCRRAPLEARFDGPGGVPPDAFIGERPPGAPQPADEVKALGVVATPSAAASQAPSGHAPAGALGLAPRAPGAKAKANAVDRAFSLARGVWDCSTLGGAHATHTYTREDARTMKLHNVLRIGRHDYAIDELYRFDPRKELWTTTTEGRAYVGVAGRWLRDAWVFNGDMPLGGRRVSAQMVYSKISERVFRRDFTREEHGARATFAAETCRLR